MIPRPATSPSAGAGSAGTLPPAAVAGCGMIATPVEEKRRFVHALFTTIAPRYDGFNRLASLGMDQGWRRRTVRESALQPEMRVLDVCTGTGDLALLCGRQLRGRGLVIGVDFTQAMLEGAVRKARAEGSKVVWMRADALTLPFASESFDRVLIGFSTRNLPRPHDPRCHA